MEEVMRHSELSRQEEKAPSTKRSIRGRLVGFKERDDFDEVEPVKKVSASSTDDKIDEKKVITYARCPA